MLVIVEPLRQTSPGGINENAEQGMGVDNMTLPNTDGTDQPTSPIKAVAFEMDMEDYNEEIATAEAEANADEDPSSEEVETEDDGEAEVPEDDAEDVQDTDEAEDEGDGSEDGELADEAEEPTPTPGTPDKALQKLQQRLSAQDKQIGELTDGIKALLEAQQNPPQQTKGNAAPPPSDEPDTTDDDLTDLLAKFDIDGDDDDLPTRKELKGMASSVKELAERLSARKTPVSKADNSELEKKIAELSGIVQNFTQTQQAEKAWGQFKADYGFDGKPVWDEAYAEAGDMLPGEKYGDARLELAQKLFDQKVEAKKADNAKPDPKPAPKKKHSVPPASSSTRKPAKGTKTAPTGARGATVKGSAGTKLPPVFVPSR